MRTKPSKEDLRKFTACPHFQVFGGRPRCLSPKTSDNRCVMPRNIPDCPRLIIPRTRFPLLAEFIEQRLETTFSGKVPYEKTKMALEFAETLCSILQDEGVSVQSEHEVDTKWEIPLKSGHSTTIISDAIASTEDDLKIAIEIKYMERGLYYIPDMKVIAWDYLHFKKFYPEHYFLLISGAKLAHNPNKEQVISHFSDHTIDLNLWGDVNIDQKIRSLITLLKEPQKMITKKVVINNPADWQPIDTKFKEISIDTEFLSNASSKSYRGRLFEQLIKRFLEKEGKACSMENRKIHSHCFCTEPIPITIEVDLCVPDCLHPRSIIECKNIENINRDGKMMIFDAWVSRMARPNANYELWLGPNVKHYPKNLLAGEIHSIVQVVPK